MTALFSGDPEPATRMIPPEAFRVGDKVECSSSATGRLRTHIEAIPA